MNKLIKRLFDYDIVGEYYDSDGKGHFRKKYIKKWYLKSRKKRRKL